MTDKTNTVLMGVEIPAHMCINGKEDGSIEVIDLKNGRVLLKDLFDPINREYFKCLSAIRRKIELQELLSVMETVCMEHYEKIVLGEIPA